MKKNLLQNIFIFLATLVFFILMFFNSFLVLTKTAVFPKDYQEVLYYKDDNIILNIIFLIVFSITLYMLGILIKKYISVKRLVLIVMIYLFIVSLLFALLRRDYVQFDPFNVIDQASNFIRDNYTGLDKGNNYLYIYSHQITTVFMFQIILSTFGRATFILYLMQCFSISFIAYYLYKLADIMFDNETISYLTIILTAICFPLIFYVAFIYGLLIGMVLVLISFYSIIKYTKNKHWYNLVIFIFTINIAILFIGNNLIHLLAICTVIIIYCIKKLDFKLISAIFLSFIVMLAAKSIIFNYYEVVSQKDMPIGVNKISWIAMGMQEGDREAGWWNSFNYDIMTEEDYNNEKVVEISKKSINQRIDVFKNNPEYALDFYKRKYDNQFIEPTFQSLVITAPQKDFDNDSILLTIKNNILEQLYFGITYKVLFTIMKVFQIFIYIFSSFFAFVLLKKKEELWLFIPIAFIGGSIFHMIWEAKSRYIFPYFIFLIPLAAAGFVYFINYYKNKNIRKGVK